MIDINNIIHADPSKAFFIDMLTRDISLSECILDLLDNSVHSMIRHNKLDVMQLLIDRSAKKKRVSAEVNVTFKGDKFSIVDTCGGISIEEARDNVFLFGNPKPDKSQTGLGVYGIGMKRGFFKIGKDIEVKSHTSKEEFKVHIDVNTWKKDPKWELEFEYAREKKADSGGTSITIKDLNEIAANYFNSVTFKRTLLEKISTTYALFIDAGLTITANGTEAAAEVPQLAGSSDLKPLRKLQKFKGVETLIMAGVSPKEDRTPHGWYVFCNGRLVLPHDQSERTGWGVNNTPSFHNKFNHFLGFVYFKSKDGGKLPWTTTKDNIELEHPVYQAALAEMQVLSRPVLDFLTRLYPGDIKEEGESERAALHKAKPIPVRTLAKEKDSIFSYKPRKVSENGMVSIQYKRKKPIVEKVKKAIGKEMSASRIGEYTFDWFFDRNCK
jgi:hypothetical protein